MNETEQLTTTEALDHLFDLYADDVYRFAVYLIGNRDEAKDVVQEVFLRAYKSWNQFRGESQAKTWLIKITRNYIHDVYRKKQRERNYIENIKAESTNSTERFDEALAINDIVSRLSSNYRQVITLRIIHDISIEDTAQILGWSASKVRTTQHRALKKLKELMEEIERGSTTIKETEKGW